MNNIGFNKGDWRSVAFFLMGFLEGFVETGQALELQKATIMRFKEEVFKKMVEAEEVESRETE